VKEVELDILKIPFPAVPKGVKGEQVGEVYAAVIVLPLIIAQQ
jgi:hypothetical protein